MKERKPRQSGVHFVVLLHEPSCRTHIQTAINARKHWMEIRERMPYPEEVSLFAWARNLGTEIHAFRELFQGHRLHGCWYDVAVFAELIDVLGNDRFLGDPFLHPPSAPLEAWIASKITELRKSLALAQSPPV